MSFEIGQRVVCVDADVHMEWPQNRGRSPHMPLVAGAEYRVRWNSKYTTKSGIVIDGVRLCGIERLDGLDTPFDARRFLPLEEKSAAMELFRAIAAGTHVIPDDQPIRVPAPVNGWTVESLTADILRRATPCAE